MMALAGGVVACVLGIIGLIIWFGEFIQLLLAAVPIMLILGGALATYLGIEEIKDKKASENFEPESEELKQEVETLKEEIKGLKEEKTSTDAE